MSLGASYSCTLITGSMLKMNGKHESQWLLSLKRVLQVWNTSYSHLLDKIIIREIIRISAVRVWKFCITSSHRDCFRNGGFGLRGSFILKLARSTFPFLCLTSCAWLIRCSVQLEMASQKHRPGSVLPPVETVEPEWSNNGLVLFLTYANVDYSVKTRLFDNTSSSLNLTSYVLTFNKAHLLNANYSRWCPHSFLWYVLTFVLTFWYILHWTCIWAPEVCGKPWKCNYIKSLVWIWLHCLSRRQQMDGRIDLIEFLLWHTHFMKLCILLNCHRKHIITLTNTSSQQCT